MPAATSAQSAGGFHAIVEKVKRDLIADALEKSHGNQATAAKLLDLSYDQFRHYRRKYELD